MKLRRQLLLVATVALALPWAGCQYVKEMDRVLRQGQIESLQATAQAVASRIASDAPLQFSLIEPTQLLSLKHPELAFYAQPIAGDVFLDGYSDDWSHSGFLASPSLVSDQSINHSFDFLMGQKDDYLYLFVTVKDSDRQFYNPLLGVEKSDHLSLHLNLNSGLQNFQIFSAASGIAAIERQGANGDWYREHKISAVWSEEGELYNVEIRLPLPWAEKGLDLQARNGASGSANPKSNNDTTLTPVIIPRLVYDEVLEVFQRQGVKLYLTVAGGWTLGQSGTVAKGVAPAGFKTWVYWLIRAVVGQDEYPKKRATEFDDRLLGAELHLTPSSDVMRQWYIEESRMVARVVVPVILPNGKMVSVVAEESTDSVEVLTTGAIGRLLFYSILASAAVALALLFYASYLSFRVRKLNRNVQLAVDSDGRIGDDFVVSQSLDEIGDLSRSYSALLQRVHSYNSYLEGLSSKLSHELRTPLAIVSSSLDNLSHCAVSSEADVYVERANDGVQRLSSILNSMGAASKLEQSIQSSETEWIDVAELLDQVAAAYKEIYLPCSVELKVVGERPFDFVGAPELLVQMLDKLVENAVDFAGAKGWVCLELKKGKDCIVIRVINNGPLLPESLQGQIFDSMVSVREGEAGGEYHLGLGLYIARLIVQFHGGEITAYNHPDGESVVFEISLPAN